LEVFSKSDIGLVRNQNQDDCRFGVISPSCVWAVVCDGMGGANGGNIASATAVDYISTKITDLYKDDMTKEQIGELMAEIVVNANMKVFEMSMKDPELTGMGTTCEFVFVKDTTVHVSASVLRVLTRQQIFALPLRDAESCSVLSSP
jgi:PPM family protein phosphatase